MPITLIHTLRGLLHHENRTVAELSRLTGRPSNLISANLQSAARSGSVVRVGKDERGHLIWGGRREHANLPIPGALLSVMLDGDVARESATEAKRLGVSVSKVMQMGWKVAKKQMRREHKEKKQACP